jgi:hypothetical protein
VPSWIERALIALTFQERALYVASVGAVALAWAVARRHSEHRPLAVLLSIGLGCDLARRSIKYAFIAPAYLRFHHGPFDGWARVVAHLDEALFLTWPAAFAATALVSFDESGTHIRRSLLAVAGIWAAAVGALALTYPLTRGPVLARCYLAAELAAVLTVVVTIGGWVPERRSPQLHQVSIALLCVAELAALTGPWRINLFGSWPLAQSVYFALFLLLIVLQGGSLWLFRGRSQ